MSRIGQLRTVAGAIHLPQSCHWIYGWTERNLVSGNRSTNYDDAVREMLNFVEKGPRSLAGHLCSDPRESPSVSDPVLDARRWRSSGS